MHTHYLKSLITLVIVLFTKVSVMGQVHISGPDCVIPSVEYQYNIGANWKDSSDLQICIQGGHLTDSSLCYNGKPISFIRVVWSGDGNNSITIRSSSGDTSLSVSTTGLLDPGTVDSASRMQSLDTLSIPRPINCSAAVGGNCSPVYQYQWQQSENGMAWTNIDEAIAAGLQFSSPVKQTTYYRRKVTEKMTRSVDYSNIAIIAVTGTKTN
jgi:hypothetical protein